MTSPIPLSSLAVLLERAAAAMLDELATTGSTETRIVSQIAAAGLRMAAELAAKGEDPLVRIEQIRDVVGELTDADRDINAAIRAKFGAREKLT